MILVLGGHGFVGRAVQRVLRSQKKEFVCASRRDGIDLKNLDVFTSFLAKTRPSEIINLAAHVGSIHYVNENAATVIGDNVQMALNMYLAATRVDTGIKIINPLSNCSYPGDANIHYEPDWWKGEVHDSVFSYGNAKRFVYVLSRNFRKQYGVRSVNFLVPNTFGPGDYLDPQKTHALNGMVIRMLHAKREGAQRFEIWGTGSPVREWGYIDDMAAILCRGLDMEGDLVYPVNIAQNKGYSIRESAQMIAKAMGFSGELWFNDKYQDGAPTKILDDRRFRELFPDFVFFDHELGIRETAKYYEEALNVQGL